LRMPSWATTAIFSSVGYFFGLQRGFPVELLTILKVVPVLCLVAVSLEMGARSKLAEIKSYTSRLAIGLLFCSVGDVFLELEHLHPLLFIGGLGSFLIGHIFYVLAFKLQAGLALAPAAVAYSFSVGMFLFLRPHLDADFVIPVAMYSFVIGSMGAFASSRFLHGQTDSFSRMAGLLGALSFILSDSILAVNKFRSPIPQAKTLVMVTYYLGQLGICMSGSTIPKED